MGQHGMKQPKLPPFGTTVFAQRRSWLGRKVQSVGRTTAVAARVLVAPLRFQSPTLVQKV